MSTRAPHSRAGLTLIEIMVVVVIIALGAGAASMGLGSLTRTNLRSACVHMMALSRYAYNRALTNGTTVRIQLDMSDETVELSEAEGRVSLVRSDQPIRQELARDEEKGDPGAAIDPIAMARAKLEKPDELVLPPSPFAALTTPSGKVINRFKKQPLGDDIRITKVIVAHEALPRTEGKADLFFFSNGLTQHAVVQLTDRDDTVYSVEIRPLSGKGTVHNVPFEPEVLMDDPSERDERASELEDR